MRLSIYLDNTLEDKLRKEATVKGIKLSHYITDICNAYYTGFESITLEKQHTIELLTKELEEKRARIDILQSERDYLRGVINVTLVRALPEPKISLFTRLFRRKKIAKP